MINIVFLLEESSAKAFLESFLPRIFPEVSFQYIPHEGKQDLEKSIPRKIRGWGNPQPYFVILRDQDAADCQKIKNNLKKLCKNAGREDALVRIACRELESWYLGDLKSVETALGKKNLSRFQGKAKYKNPDNIVNPSKEIQRLVPEYQKISSSRFIGKTIESKRCVSKSFQVFINGLKSIIREAKI